MFGTYTDLVETYGQEKIDEISQSTAFDSVLNEYVVIRDAASMKIRAEKALSDACVMVKSKLGCCYDMTNFDQWITDGEEFPIIKMYHIKLAYNYLKYQSTDCKKCVSCMDEFVKICSCQKICSSVTTTICLEKTPCFIVETDASCIPSMCEKCDASECYCGTIYEMQY